MNQVIIMISIINICYFETNVRVAPYHLPKEGHARTEPPKVTQNPPPPPQSNTTEPSYINTSTREGFLRKNIVAVSFFSKMCYTPIFLIHVHIFSIK